MLNSGDALERLADIDTIVFDKTGTLTLPRPSLANGADIAPEDLALAGSLALASKHPLAKAVAAAAGAKSPLAAHEFTGQGVTVFHEGKRLKLGSVAYCKAEKEAVAVAAAWPDASLIAFQGPVRAVVFAVRQAPRPDAKVVVARLARAGLAIQILSGDRQAAVEEVARELSISTFAAGLKPADKIARLKALRAAGHRVLMVGDGLNDAPALAAADVSISPISAAHLTQAQADAVFLGDKLGPIADAIFLARKAKSLMLENLWLSVIYNFIAVPVAIAGFVTPLIAALAMSGSSVLVTLNALRARSARGVAR
jgi:Cu2+-exporting ATPase